MSKISADFYEPYFQHVKKCRPKVVHPILFIRRLGGTDRKLFFPYVKYEYFYKAILYSAILPCSFIYDLCKHCDILIQDTVFKCVIKKYMN